MSSGRARTSRSAPSGVVINMVTKSGTNRFTGQALQTYQGASDAVGQHRRVAEAAPASGPTRTRSDYITNTNVQAGGPLLAQQAVLLRLVQLPADAHQRPRTSRPCRRFPVAARRTPAIRTPPTSSPVPARLTYPVRAEHRFDVLRLEAALRQAEPRRRATTVTAGLGHRKEYRPDSTTAGRRACWNWVLSGSAVREHERQLQQRALPAPTRRPACSR